MAAEVDDLVLSWEDPPAEPTTVTVPGGYSLTVSLPGGAAETVFMDAGASEE